MPDPERDYLTLLLDQYWFAPPVALWRAIELRTLASEAFPRPILDVGCGDGLIARVLFDGDPSIEVGFDPWLDQVRKAPATGAYASVQQAMGHAMPYASGSFGSVLSNSVFEHIPDLDPVLDEIARVVRPGGRVLFTVPSDAFRRLLAGYRDRIAAGDQAGAEAYATEIDAWLSHHRYPTPDEWRETLSGVGLRLLRTAYYVPAAVMTLWDRGNTTYGVRTRKGMPLYRWIASPRLRRFGYQRWVRRRIVRALGQRWRQAYAMDVPVGEVGGGLLVVGEKVA
jgi:SAM-dependent methyltransferase